MSIRPRRILTLSIGAAVRARGCFSVATAPRPAARSSTPNSSAASLPLSEPSPAPIVISTERFLRVISTERSEWRNLDKMLIFNRFIDYALCAPLEMTIIPNLSPRFSVARGDPDLREIHPATAIIDNQQCFAEGDLHEASSRSLLSRRNASPCLLSASPLPGNDLSHQMSNFIPVRLIEATATARRALKSSPQLCAVAAGDHTFRLRCP